MKQLTVNLGARSYDIHIGHGVLRSIGSHMCGLRPGGRVFVITDDTVAGLYAPAVTDALAAAGYVPHLLSFPHGEQSKTMDTLTRLVEEMLSAGITRADRVVALGGGVVGDTAGFAAHIVLRGVPYIQIPTTLLAQVDSSVGGKVAVDVPQGKNLVGAFHQPACVLIDPDCLATLPDETFSDGMAEVIKYGLIASRPLYEKLAAAGGRTGVMADIQDIIYACVDIKRRIVEADELDTGGRMVLNFGHTLGHVIEKQYHYETYTHGQAVGAGMVAVARLAERQGLCEAGLAQTIAGLLTQYGLPTDIPFGGDALSALALDKKNDGGMLNLVIVPHIGTCTIHPMPVAELTAMLS